MVAPDSGRPNLYSTSLLPFPPLLVLPPPSGAVDDGGWEEKLIAAVRGSDRTAEKRPPGHPPGTGRRETARGQHDGAHDFLAYV
jgi:hypothetical protein